MTIKFTKHAEDMLRERNIDRTLVEYIEVLGIKGRFPVEELSHLKVEMPTVA
jgi:hypothetical protein